LFPGQRRAPRESQRDPGEKRRPEDPENLIKPMVNI
jgi:hypothetical protein